MNSTGLHSNVSVAHSTCEHCPISPENRARNAEFLRLRQSARLLLREIRRLDLNFREYTLAEVILDKSLGWGLPRVVVPKLDIFTALTGVATSHVHLNLGRLKEMGLIDVEKTPGGPAYRITNNPETWRCRMRVSRASVKEATHALKMYNGLDDAALPTEEHHRFFNGYDGAQILAQVITEPVSVTNFSQGELPV